MGNRLSINQKMWVITAFISLLFLFVQLFFSLTLNHAKDIGVTRSSEVMYADQKDKLQVATHSMALSLGEVLKSVSAPEERVQLIRDAVNDIRFEDDRSGYFFIYQETTVITVPPKPELAGTDLGKAKDVNGVLFVTELHNRAAEGGGFVDYVFPKPEAGDQPKLGYSEIIPGTEYWIGTGVYLDNITATKTEIGNQITSAINKRNLILVLVVVPLFGLLLFALFYISRSMVNPLSRVSTGLSSAADQITSASAMVSQLGQSLAEGATQQAASLQETTASLNELTNRTKENSKHAREADLLMDDTKLVVETANKEMHTLTTSMDHISESSDEIHKIIKTINEIAFQTNLLALNAAVEAARAGDAGAGFAVVASEVRNLAVRAADSAQDTTLLIANTSKRIKEGEESAQRTSEAFKQIQKYAIKVDEIVAEIASASEEQTMGIDQISAALNEMNEVVQKTTAMAEEEAGSSEEMAAQAKEMEMMAQELITVVNGKKKASATHYADQRKPVDFNPPTGLKSVHRKAKMVLQSLLLIIILGTSLAKAQSVDIHGFIFSEMYLDTKEAVASREADVLLFPKKPEYDALGNDLTDDMCFHMVSFNSRINATATGLDAFGAAGKAVVEIDFFGTGENYANMVRMRHAFFELKWDGTALLMGQYWHPMFNPGVFPQVLGFGGGAPINTLSRDSQLRLTRTFTPVISGSFTISSQRDFTSTGPNGASSMYKRQSGLPEVNLQFQYKTEHILAASTIGFKSIQPSEVDPSGNDLDETLESWHSNLLLKYSSDQIIVKLAGIYGQNMTNFVMLGGYAERTVTPDHISYTNLITSSFWSEIITNNKMVNAGLFMGLSQNHGAMDEIANNSGIVTANIYARGGDIKSLIRVAPRITVTSGPLMWGFEYTWTSAAYGTNDFNGEVVNTTDVSMSRFHVAAIYKF